MLYTGLDYHGSFSYTTTMNDKGEIIGQKKLPGNGGIVEFLKEFGESMEVAIEATPIWYWLYDHLPFPASTKLLNCSSRGYLPYSRMVSTMAI